MLRKPQFSILTLLMLMACVALLIACLRASSELEVIKAENVRLRNELGMLTVDDEAKLYVMSVPTTEQNAWRWRIHLPLDIKLRMGITDAGTIPAPGTAKNADSNLAYFDDPIPLGESVVDAKLYRNGEGIWTVSVRTSDGVMNCSLVHGEQAWLDGSAFFRTRSGSRTTREVDASTTIALLRHVVVKHDSLPGNSPQPNPGIMIWLEPVP